MSEHADQNAVKLVWWRPVFLRLYYSDQSQDFAIKKVKVTCHEPDDVTSILNKREIGSLPSAVRVFESSWKHHEVLHEQEQQ